jgi:hypothetical protein
MATSFDGQNLWSSFGKAVEISYTILKEGKNERYELSALAYRNGDRTTDACL